MDLIGKLTYDCLLIISHVVVISTVGNSQSEPGYFFEAVLSWYNSNPCSKKDELNSMQMNVQWTITRFSNGVFYKGDQQPGPKARSVDCHIDQRNLCHVVESGRDQQPGSKARPVDCHIGSNAIRCKKWKLLICKHAVAIAAVNNWQIDSGSKSRFVDCNVILGKQCHTIRKVEVAHLQCFQSLYKRIDLVVSGYFTNEPNYLDLKHDPSIAVVQKKQCHTMCEVEDAHLKCFLWLSERINLIGHMKRVTLQMNLQETNTCFKRAVPFDVKVEAADLQARRCDRCCEQLEN
ncbi:hypothetical protein T11_17985 [Trichinella zimbabwensis]|uniref:Uncharacterized protein n=1 Tax=Trichinella zimbabwensis TaxID=268475 RepID=A0A0V1I2P5_9BILA|nr:hypothetical protein T11_17985 [Trichinella zimbabwensis]